MDDGYDWTKWQNLNAAPSHWLWDCAAGAIDRDHGGMIISERLSGLWNADSGKAAITEKEERGLGKWELVSFLVTQAKWKQLCQLKHETSEHGRANWGYLTKFVALLALEMGKIKSQMCSHEMLLSFFLLVSSYPFLIFDLWPHLVSVCPSFFITPTSKKKMFSFKMYVLPADRWALHQITETLSRQKIQSGIRMQIFLPNTSIFIQDGTSIIQHTLHSVLNSAQQSSFQKPLPFLHTESSWLLTWF